MAGPTRRGAEDVLVEDTHTGEVFEIDRASLKSDPERFDVQNKDFDPPTAQEVADAKKRAKDLSWKRPDLDHEKPEFERASEDIGVPTIDLLGAAKEAPLVDLTLKMWATMGNTDSWDTDTIGKAVYHARLYDKDIRAVVLAIGKNEMQAPMVLSFEDGSTRLIGGNTRLMVFRALGITPKVLLVPVKNRKGGEKMSREVIAFRYALTIPSVAVRLAKEKSELAEVDLLRARGLPRAKKMVETLATLADRAEERTKDLEEFSDAESRKLQAIREKALMVAHEMAKSFDDLVPVYHALSPESARTFRALFDLYFEMNQTWFQINRKSFDPLRTSAEVHSLFMACSSLVNQYAMSLRGAHAETTGEVKVARELIAFKDALIARSVAQRFAHGVEAMDREAMEFPTEEALAKYLKEHPRAKANGHSVKKPKHDDNAKPAEKAEIESASKNALSQIKNLESMLEGHASKRDADYVSPLAEQMPHRMHEFRHHVDKMCEGVNHIPPGKDRDHAKAIVKKLDDAWEAPNKERGFRWDRADKSPSLPPDHVEKMLKTTKPLVEELDKLLGGQRTLIARILSRMAMEHATPEAMKKYLDAHPKADKGNHSVKKNDGEKKDSGKGSEDSGSKAKRFDHPEFKDKSSPYFVNTENKHLKKFGDPATWNYKDMMNLKEDLKKPFKRPGGMPEGPKEKEMSEAIRQISNWGGKVHKENPDEVDRDLGMGRHSKS